MVLGEVREHADAEVDLVGAVEHQRVGRDLHDDVCTARGLHLGEQLLQLEGFGVVRSVCRISSPIMF